MLRYYNFLSFFIWKCMKIYLCINSILTWLYSKKKIPTNTNCSTTFFCGIYFRFCQIRKDSLRVPLSNKFFLKNNRIKLNLKVFILIPFHLVARECLTGTTLIQHVQWTPFLKHHHAFWVAIWPFNVMLFSFSFFFFYV